MVLAEVGWDGGGGGGVGVGGVLYHFKAICCMCNAVATSWLQVLC